MSTAPGPPCKPPPPSTSTPEDAVALVWLQIADQQYHRIGALRENPTVDADAVYNARSDQWSVPLGERGFLFYAVVSDPARVIVLRLVSLG